jgi:hypothetical protein
VSLRSWYKNTSFPFALPKNLKTCIRVAIDCRVGDSVKKKKDPFFAFLFGKHKLFVMYYWSKSTPLPHCYYVDGVCWFSLKKYFWLCDNWSRVPFGGEYWFSCNLPFELSSLYVEWLVKDKNLPCVHCILLCTLVMHRYFLQHPLLQQNEWKPLLKRQMDLCIL